MTQRTRRRQLMNASQYARHIGVDQAQISRAISRGEIVPRDDGMIDVGHADATYGRKRRLRAARRARLHEHTDRHAEALLTKGLADVEMRQRKAARMDRSLVEREVRQAEIDALVTRVLHHLTLRRRFGA